MTDSARIDPAAIVAPRRGERAFIPALEGLRGAVALIVVTGHTGQAVALIGWMDDYPGNPLWGTILHRLAVAFPIFFVMTGYLLYRSFALATLTGGERPNVKRYLWRRALRILPAYWALMVASLAITNLAGAPAKVHWGSWAAIWDILRPTLMLQIYQPSVMPLGMEHTWSNANDLAFYLVMPLLAMLVARYAGRARDVRGRLRRMVVPLVGLILIGLGFTLWTHLPYMMKSPQHLWPMQYLWPTSYVGWLAAGMILAALSAAAEVDPAVMPSFYRLAGQHPLRCWLAALVVYALACLSPFEITYKVDYPGLPAGFVDYWLFVGFAVLIVAPLTVPGARSRFINVLLGNRVMRYYGKISYSVFLWHVVVYLLFVVPIFGPAPAQSQFWPVYLVELAFSTVVAIISYYVIERPFHKLRPWLGKAPAKLSVEVASRDDFSQPTEPATLQPTEPVTVQSTEPVTVRTTPDS